MNPTQYTGQVVIGIIVHNGKILLGKVREENLVSFNNIPYIFPGGKVEAGETIDQAVAREINEEVGAVISNPKKIASRLHPLTQKEIIYFVCEVNGELPSKPNPENADISEILLVEPTQLTKYMPTINPDVLHYFEIEEVA